MSSPLPWFAETSFERLKKIKETYEMKKLMTLMLGLAFAFSTVAVSFAQDAPKKEETKKTKKKGGKKKEEAPKKDGGGL
ncbi:MAG TPA: hypothetical protein VNV86_09810 [Candidatus Acidoferrum sp.]|nr:hypothetical protein [Candidatus Acidoferrum sp.]